ncbi:MAG TPA: translation initiation factor IF-2 associated domain-containing protein, partial [Xanthomonadales bacterium]|nr:translation initiation factor IF-2 associated domain-containing protein [Xanthomonadales bacterium]
MSKVTVEQLAEVLGVDVTRLVAQLNDAGIDASSGTDPVSNEDKKRLLAHLSASHGKVDSDASAPKKVTLKRKTVSELRVAGSGPRAATRTVNVEVRKKRTYVKREVVQEQMGVEYSDREEAKKLLEESRAGRAEEERKREETLEKARQLKEAEERKSVEEQERKAAEEKQRRDEEEKTRLEAKQRADEEREKRREEEKARKADEEKWRRDKEKASSPTRYGRKELHVADGAAIRRRKPGKRSKPSTSGPSEHGFSRPTSPVLREVAVPEAITVA